MVDTGFCPHFCLCVVYVVIIYFWVFDAWEFIAQIWIYCLICIFTVYLHVRSYCDYLKRCCDVSCTYLWLHTVKYLLFVWTKVSLQLLAGIKFLYICQTFRILSLIGTHGFFQKTIYSGIVYLLIYMFIWCLWTITNFSSQKKDVEHKTEEDLLLVDGCEK